MSAALELMLIAVPPFPPSPPPLLSLEDTLVDLLTVREMLLYTAELKLPLSMPYAEKEAAVERVLTELSLQHCRDTRIGRCVGEGEGERGSRKVREGGAGK